MLDGALELWESANPTEDAIEDTFQAIREGLADVGAGRTRLLREFDREFRQK
jgi:hypothetical protein